MPPLLSWCLQFACFYRWPFLASARNPQPQPPRLPFSEMTFYVQGSSQELYFSCLHNEPGQENGTGFQVFFNKKQANTIILLLTLCDKHLP